METIRKVNTEPADEYDKALVFALKKWIADEINNIYDNGVYSVCLTMKNEGGWKAGIGYNTEANAKASGVRWDTSAWKCPEFSEADNDDAVYGMIGMWLDFKGFADDAAVMDSYFGCAACAVRELTDTYIFKERFNKNIPVILMYDGMGEMTAAYSAAANHKGQLDESFFEL